MQIMTTLPLLFWLGCLLFLNFLVAFVKTCSAVLNKIHEAGYHILVSWLWRKSFHPFTTECAGDCGLSQRLYYVQLCSFHIQYVDSFYHEKMLFFKFFFSIYWEGHIIFTFRSINTLFHIYWFVCVEPFLHLRDKSLLVMVSILFNMLLNLLFSWELLHLYSSGILGYSFFSFLFVCLSDFGIRVILAL